MGNSAYLGIDVSKGYADMIILSSNKELLEPAFRLYDSDVGQKQLLEIIKGLFQKGIEKFYSGVESTGGYENNWVAYLQDLGKDYPLFIARINPKGVKSLGEAGLVRTITDSVSARNIALYLIDFANKVNYLSPTLLSKVYSAGRKHTSFIRMLKKQKNQLENQLEKLIYQQLGCLICYCRHGFPGWLLLLLKKYPSTASIVKAGESRLCKIQGISHGKAVAVLNKVSSVNSHDSEHLDSLIKSTAEQILHLDKAINAQKIELQNRFKNEKAVELLISLPGVGEQSAVELLIELEDVSRFENAKKVGAYFGTHPMWKQSGDGLWGNHMSKKGRSSVRATLYMSSLTAIRRDELFKKIYSKCRAAGKNHYNAMGVVMNKMLRVIYGILKNKVRYDREIDLSNQQHAKLKQQLKEERAEEVENEKQLNLERFIEGATKELPVSRRYIKKKRQSPKLQKEACAGSSAS